MGGILPLGGAAYITKDYKVVQAVPGIPDGDVMKQTAVCSQKVVRLGLYLSPFLVNDPRPPVLCPVFVEWE